MISLIVVFMLINIIIYFAFVARMATMEEYIRKLEAERNCILFSVLTLKVSLLIANVALLNLIDIKTIYASVDEFRNSHYMSTGQYIGIVKRTNMLITVVS